MTAPHPTTSTALDLRYLAHGRTAARIACSLVLVGSASNARLAAASPQLIEITIETSPVSATVSLDGSARIRGTTPFRAMMTFGPHRLVLTADGYVTINTVIDVGSLARRRAYSFALTPSSGRHEPAKVVDHAPSHRPSSGP